MKKHNFYSAILETKKDKKFVQRLEELELNRDFQKEIDILRRKWWQEINKSWQIGQEMTDVIRKGKFTGPDSLNEEAEKKLRFLQKESTNLLLNKELGKDTTILAKNFKLYPADYWSNVIIFIVFGKSEDEYLRRAFFANNFFTKSLKNCDIRIEKNSLTNESELLVQIFPNTSLDDIKKSWNEIMKIQKKLRESIGEKRFYPKLAMATAKKLKEIDKNKVSDWEKQELLYGEDTSGEKEAKRKNNLRQLRRRYKI